MAEDAARAAAAAPDDMAAAQDLDAARASMVLVERAGRAGLGLLS
jgi:hypothetical protein